jgi:outer membrane protein
MTDKLLQRAALLMTIMLLAPVAWAGAGSTTLEDAYQSALGTNEYMKIAEEGVVQSETRIDQAWTYIYPKLYGQAGYTRYNEVLPPGDSQLVFQPLGQFSAGLILTQPLYTGGRTLAALRTAKTQSEISRKDLISTKESTMLSVASAYYEVLKARKRVEMSRDSVARMERHKEVTEREAATRKSKANVSSLLRARTLVSQAKIFLVRDEDMLKIARQQLTLVAQVPENAVLVEPPPQQLPAETIDEMKALALQNRDDYLASKLNQKVAEENVTIVKGGHYPQAYAEGALQYLNSRPETITDGTIYYGGIRLVVPIFEGGLMKAEVSEAKSKKRQSELATQYLQRSIETDVYEAYVNYQTVISVLKAAKLQYADAKDNFNTVESLFGQGLVPSLALIDAQQALFVTERELVNTTYDEQLAVIRLKKSVGLLGKSRKG